MRGVFVTGTDTGVGKTFVTCALARAARAAGLRVVAFKPIETGCSGVGEDQAALAEAAGDVVRGTYRFALPAAPLVAARAEGATIDLGRVRADFDLAKLGADLVLVEGAGGWRVPITASDDMAALARLTGFPVLIVARAGLGTINHSLLTIEAVQRDGLSVHGLVLSARPGDDLGFAESNAEQISARSQVPVFVTPAIPAV